MVRGYGGMPGAGAVIILLRSSTIGGAAIRTLPRVVTCCGDVNCDFNILDRGACPIRRGIGG